MALCTALVLAKSSTSSGNAEYPLRSAIHLFKWPATATAHWGRQGSQNGIVYANGGNTGFFAIDGVTLTQITPTSSHFSYSIPTNHTYNGSAQGIGVVTPPAEFTTTTGGSFTVYYTGTGTTRYAKSATLPTGEGTYMVTVEMSGGTEYLPTAIPIFLGEYAIAPMRDGDSYVSCFWM